MTEEPKEKSKQPDVMSLFSTREQKDGERRNCPFSASVLSQPINPDALNNWRDQANWPQNYSQKNQPQPNQTDGEQSSDDNQNDFQGSHMHFQ